MKIDEKMFKKESKNERIQLLEDNAYKTLEKSYQKPFEKEEIVIFKNSLSEVMIKMKEIEDDFKLIKEAHNLKMKPLKDNIRELLENIKYKCRSVNEIVYMFDYQDENIMAIYNADGDLIEQRPMLPEEKQMRIMKQASNQ